jgi:hypothetical protein
LSENLAKEFITMQLGWIDFSRKDGCLLLFGQQKEFTFVDIYEKALERRC